MWRSINYHVWLVLCVSYSIEQPHSQVPLYGITLWILDEAAILLWLKFWTANVGRLQPHWALYSSHQLFNDHWRSLLRIIVEFYLLLTERSILFFWYALLFFRSWFLWIYVTVRLDIFIFINLMIIHIISGQHWWCHLDFVVCLLWLSLRRLYPATLIDSDIIMWLILYVLLRDTMIFINLCRVIDGQAFPSSFSIGHLIFIFNHRIHQLGVIVVCIDRAGFVFAKLEVKEELDWQKLADTIKSEHKQTPIIYKLILSYHGQLFG